MSRDKKAKKKKSIGGGGGIKNVSKKRKPRRLRPGTRALKEIKKYQKSTDLLY